MRQQILRKVPLFARLSDSELRLIERRLQLRVYRAGDLVFSEGDASDAMYLAQSGELEVVPDAAPGRTPLACLEAGCFFGDVALVSSRPRTTAVRVTSDRAEIWLLTTADFQDLLSDNPALADKVIVDRGRRPAEPIAVDPQAVKALRDVPLFAKLSDDALAALAAHMRQETFAEGDWIYREGTPGDALYIVTSGAVKVVSDAKTEAAILETKGHGGVIGEQSLLTGEPHDSAAQAITDVTVWRLNRGDFNSVAGTHPAIRAVSAPARRPRPKAVATTAGVSWTGRVRAGAREAAFWFRSKPRSAQVRIAVIVLLLLYLFLVSAPATVLSAVSPVTGDMGARFALLVASPTPTPTNTPTPTKIPTPTNTPLPTAAPTATPVPTEAPPPPPTEVPTATPKPTRPPTPKPRPPTATPTPSVDFIVAEKRPLTACENGLNTIVFVEVYDMNGNPMDGVPLVFNTPDDRFPAYGVSGYKAPGKTEFVLQCGDAVNGCSGWKVYVGPPFTGQIADGIRNNFKVPDPGKPGGWMWVEERCPETGQVGNVGKHWSWKIVFKKTRP